MFISLIAFGCFSGKREIFNNATVTSMSRTGGLDSIVILDDFLPTTRFSDSHFLRGREDAVREFARIGVHDALPSTFNQSN